MLSEIIVLLDRSGSMASCASDHRGGLKQFVEDQKKLDGEVNFTLVQFDSQNPFELIYDAVPIDKVGDIPLNPRGGTPLLDSLGKTIGHVSDRLLKEKPNQVIFLVITDGEENDSREFNPSTIRKLVKEKENNKELPWIFMYLGANVDAFTESRELGIDSVGTIANYAVNTVAVKNLYKGTSDAITRGRKMRASGASHSVTTQAMNYTSDELASFTEVETFNTAETFNKVENK